MLQAEGTADAKLLRQENARPVGASVRTLGWESRNGWFRDGSQSVEGHCKDWAFTLGE